MVRNEKRQERWQKEQDRRKLEIKKDAKCDLLLDDMLSTFLGPGKRPRRNGLSRDEVVEGLVGYFLKEGFPPHYDKMKPEARQAAVEGFLEAHHEFRGYFDGKNPRKKLDVCYALRSGLGGMGDLQLKELYISHILKENGHSYSGHAEK